MSEKQRQAQQERRAREKEAAAQAAANAAEAAADSLPDTVDPGSPDEPVEVKAKVDHSARMEMLESLRNKPEDMDEYIRSETEEEPVAQEAAPEPEPAPEPEAPAAPEMVTVKVNGQETQVSKTDVDAAGGVAAYQIVQATKAQLDQAKQEKLELAQLLEQTKQLLVSQKPPEPQKSRDELIKEKVLQIQLGTPEEAADALKALLDSNAQPKIDPVAIANQVTAQVAMNAAAQAFTQRNADLLQNQYFAQLAMLMEHDKLGKSKPSDWNKFYIDLETEFRAGLGKPATTQVPSTTTQQAGQPTSAPVADKLARKADIVNLPTAGTRVPPKEEPKPLSRDDRINMLRKARGQPVG